MKFIKANMTRILKKEGFKKSVKDDREQVLNSRGICYAWRPVYGSGFDVKQNGSIIEIRYIKDNRCSTKNIDLISNFLRDNFEDLNVENISNNTILVTTNAPDLDSAFFKKGQKPKSKFRTVGLYGAWNYINEKYGFDIVSKRKNWVYGALKIGLANFNKDHDFIFLRSYLRSNFYGCFETFDKDLIAGEMALYANEKLYLK